MKGMVIVMNNLEKFGKIFICDVRDKTIRSFNKIFSGEMKGTTAETIHDLTKNFSEVDQEKVQNIITIVIDQCMHNMLFMAEEHEEIELKYNDDNLVDESDGLAGELYTEDGWIEKYSEF